MYESYFNPDHFDKSRVRNFFELLNHNGDFDGVDFSEQKWQVLERNFTRWCREKANVSDNSISSTASSSHTTLIPKHIHQIWLGKEMPRVYKEFCHAWKEKHPDWQYTLWGEEAYDLVEPTLRKQIKLTKNYGIISDVLRYQILNTCGGVYIDCDIVCIRPIDPIIVNADFVVTVNDGKDPKKVGNAFLASMPAHPITEELLRTIQIPREVKRPDDVFKTTGPVKFGSVIFQYIANPQHQNQKILALPKPFFSPLPGAILIQYSKTYIDTMAKYLMYETFGVHLCHWSWVRVNNSSFFLVKLWKYFRRRVSIRKLVRAPFAFLRKIIGKSIGS